MGGINQLNFIKKNARLVSGPILEVGSKDYGNTPDFRSVFPDCEYVGVDMEEGKGVDLVLDLTLDFNLVDEKLNGKRFKTVLCLSVLEHCKDPFKMCNNISQLLADNGVLFVSVPFSWRIHGYPSDYWRFTSDGIRILFPELDFDTYAGNISTSKIGESGPIDNYMFRAEMDIHKGLELKRYSYLAGMFIYLCRKLRLLPSVFGYPYLFPPVLIDMVGIKK